MQQKVPLIGREPELDLLQKSISGEEAEFIAVYGRRRVGKTFLVRSLSENYSNFFEVTGLKKGSLKDQLAVFTKAFNQCFKSNSLPTPPKDWMQAFELLSIAAESKADKGPIIIFLDELPWLASPRSGLIQALDHYWNTRWERLPFFKLIVCGSAASWVIKHIIRNKGGLHNRLTKKIRLAPMNLGEAKTYLQTRGIKYTQQQVADLYMITGGIPYYLKQVAKNNSVPQNIDKMCFHEQGMLYGEFDELYASLFKHSEHHRLIIQELSKYRYGIERKLLGENLNKVLGGRFSNYLKELEESGFISTLKPYKNKKKTLLIKLIDEYSLFYLRWVQTFKRESYFLSPEENYWLKQYKGQSYQSWAGFSFESLCWKHLKQIRAAIGIKNILTKIGTWQFQAPKRIKNKSGAQIDLIFDRDDDVITLCEIKYTRKPFVLSKNEALSLSNKIKIFREVTGTNKQIEIALITPFGLKKNIWSEDLIDKEVHLQSLFKK